LSIADGGHDVQPAVAGAGPSPRATACSTARAAGGWWSSAAAVTGVSAAARPPVPRSSGGTASAKPGDATSGAPWAPATTPPARSAGVGGL